MSAGSVLPASHQNAFGHFGQDARQHSAPSKLVQMQAAYRQKLFEEQERKRLQQRDIPYDAREPTYHDHARQNSLVRDFFQERRYLHRSHEQLPEINQHYRLKKQEYERQQRREHSFPLSAKSKAASDPSRINYNPNEVKKDVSYLPRRPPMGKVVYNRPLNEPTQNHPNHLKPLSNTQYEKHDVPNGNYRRIPMRAAHTTEQVQAARNAINNKHNVNENNMPAKDMTPIEMAKLHQQKRRKIPQRIDHVTAQEQEPISQNNAVKNNKELRLKNANNRYQDVENEVDTSKDEVIPRQQIKSAGKVSNFKQWQQEQEARRKALQLENERAEAEQRNNNVNNNFNKNEKSFRARSNSSGSYRNDNDMQADGQYIDRGTGGDIVLNNLKWGSVPRNGRKIESDNNVQVNADTNNQATEKTLREKKMAILKKQNMKGYDEKAYSPEFNNDNVPQNNTINVDNGRNFRKTSGNANTNAFVVDLDSTNKQKNVVSNNAANYNDSGSQNRVNNMPEKKSSAKILRKMSGRPSKTPDANAEQYRESAEMYVRVAEMQLQKDDGSNIRLVECSSCGRKFAADRLPTHERTCMKTAGKQRKTFDSSKMRVKDTEQSKYVAVQSNAPEDKKSSQWRQKHEDFINTLRYAKQAAAAQAKGIDIGPPPVSQNADYVGCPHCGRRFNRTAAERHIPKCKDIKSRPPPPPKYRK